MKNMGDRVVLDYCEKHGVPNIDGFFTDYQLSGGPVNSHKGTVLNIGDPGADDALIKYESIILGIDTEKIK